MDLPKAIETLAKALNEDPGYREAWKANIAMAFKDEFYTAEENGQVNQYGTPNVHEVANKAADRFLNLLCG